MSEKIKKAITVSVTAGILLAGSSCSPSQASASDEITYLSVSWAEGPETIAELVKLADVVVEVRISGVKGIGSSTSAIGGQMPYVDFEADALNVLYGDLSSEQIIIRQGGDPEGKMVFQDDPLMEPEDTYILFLTEYAPGEYRINGGPSGRLVINNGTDVSTLPSTTLHPDERITNVAELERKILATTEN